MGVTSHDPLNLKPLMRSEEGNAAAAILSSDHEEIRMADLPAKAEIGVTTGPIRGSRKVHVAAKSGSGIHSNASAS